MKEAQKVLLLIKDEFLMFLYEVLFKTYGFSVLKAQNKKTMSKILGNNCLHLIVFGMPLAKKHADGLIHKILLDAIPILILTMNETKDLLEGYLKYDQYAYVDILNDDSKSIIKKAKKLMTKYKVTA